MWVSGPVSLQVVRSNRRQILLFGDNHRSLDGDCDGQSTDVPGIVKWLSQSLPVQVVAEPSRDEHHKDQTKYNSFIARTIDFLRSQRSHRVHACCPMLRFYSEGNQWTSSPVHRRELKRLLAPFQALFRAIADVDRSSQRNKGKRKGKPNPRLLDRLAEVLSDEVWQSPSRYFEVMHRIVEIGSFEHPVLSDIPWPLYWREIAQYLDKPKDALLHYNKEGGNDRREEGEEERPWVDMVFAAVGGASMPLFDLAALLAILESQTPITVVHAGFVHCDNIAFLLCHALTASLDAVIEAKERCLRVPPSIVDSLACLNRCYPFTLRTSKKI